MDYYEFIFILNSEEDFHRDLLINALAEAGFDTFEETTQGFNAFISSDEFNQSVFDNALLGFDEMFSFSYTKELIPQKNWNEVWESNFEPLIIKNQCYVRATFHPAQPEFPFEIVIDPKMAFGTGHHQTTSLMMEYLLEEDGVPESYVLDMGCGTGILAILAEKLGASKLLAIDYDPVCFESTLENTQLNSCTRIEALCGSKEVIPDWKFDLVLANINRNILLDQIYRYAQVLKIGGILLISGFYEEDMPILEEYAKKSNLYYSSHKKLDNWVAVKYLKET